MVSLSSEKTLPALPPSWDCAMPWQKTVFNSVSSTGLSVMFPAFSLTHLWVPAPVDTHNRFIIFSTSQTFHLADATFWVIIPCLFFCPWLLLWICLSFSEKSSSFFLGLSKILADYPGLWPGSNPVQCQTSEVLRSVWGLGLLLWIKQCFMRW